MLGRMAEFVIDKVSKDGGRLGHLTLQNIAEISSVYATPAFFIHTLGGSIPHISASVFEYTFPSSPSGDNQPKPPLQISVDSTLNASESVGNFGKGIAHFVGLPDLPVFLTVHNPMSPLKTGYNDKAGISLWSRHGRTSIGPKSFDKIVTDYKPTIFQSMSDYDVSSESSVKRVRKSMTRNADYLDEITKSGKHRGAFVTIESAWFSVDETEAFKTLQVTLEKLDRIDGFVINGLSGRPMSTTAKVKDVKEEHENELKEVNYPLLETILSKLPPNKPRFVPGPFSPKQIVELVVRGVDLFDSSCLTKMADSGDVLVLDRLGDFVLEANNINVVSSVNEDLPVREDDGIGEAKKSDVSGPVISLKDKIFFEDFSPISKACCCYTCRNHTRSYINHLYTTDELLGPVLVMIHNLNAFSKFFEVVRHGIKEDETGDGIPILLEDKTTLTLSNLSNHL